MSYLFREEQTLESHPSHPPRMGSLGRPPFSIPLPHGLSPSPLASSRPQSPVSALPSPCLLGESPPEPTWLPGAPEQARGPQLHFRPPGGSSALSVLHAARPPVPFHLGPLLGPRWPQLSSGCSPALDPQGRGFLVPTRLSSTVPLRT